VGLELIVERVDRRENAITLSEWQKLVAAHADLRIRVEPYHVVNPKTHDSIEIPAGDADSEICCAESWIPFLRFQRGRLVTRYHEDFDNPENPVRIKIGAVARQMGAVITTDAGDEQLSW
jgi:hypothetical protein